MQSDRLRHQLRIQFRLVHFLDIDEHFARGALLQFLFQLVDFRALASDDDAGTRRLDNDPDLVARTLNLDCADARRLQLVFQFGLQLHVFEQQFVVIPLDEPARLPRLGVTQPESVRMDFLTHRISLKAQTRRWSLAFPVYLHRRCQRQRLPTRDCFTSLQPPSSCRRPTSSRPFSSWPEPSALPPSLVPRPQPLPATGHSCSFPPARFPDARCAAHTGTPVPLAPGGCASCVDRHSPPHFSRTTGRDRRPLPSRCSGSWRYRLPTATASRLSRPRASS